ncbi:MAG: hypothetical protein IPM50_11625 [Acidobacteriota bacterium]|nr:MAG: hypothetical protein IPM50_11625 [Acidobacteriota bacterium]
MRTFLLITAIFCGTVAISAQGEPLTQPEYVKLLYAADNDAARAELIAVLRNRGISFTVNDGLRNLTRTKSGNDTELRRALDEADRRRRNPEASRVPTAAEAASLLTRSRQATLDAVEEMPDFVVKQQIQRSASFAGTGNFRNLDRLVVAVSYRASGEETYKLLSKNGAIEPNPQEKRSYEEAGGTSSTGEFVTVLATIFKPESKTEFKVVDTDEIRGRRSIAFDFSIEKELAKQTVAATGVTTETAVTGMKGRLWIDRETARVLRIESEATGLPEGFPISAARRTIDYDWTEIAGERFLLPLQSDVRLTVRERSNRYETRNVIRFRDYQKFGTEVIIRDDDVSPDEIQKP